MKSLFIIISLIHFALGEVTGQTLSHPETGLPFIQNYPPQITGGDAQNWQILQDKRGLIYSVNNYGILQYDGQSWRIIPAPNNSRIRALAIDHRGIIYFKAESDFGYLAPDSTGTLRAVSLIPKLKATHQEPIYINYIFTTGEKVYFISSWSILRLMNRQFRIWKGKYRFQKAFIVTNALYIQQDGRLLRMQGDSIQTLPGERLFDHVDIRGIAPFPSSRVSGESEQKTGTLLIATYTQGLFLYNGNTLKPFKTDVDGLLTESRIHYVTRLPQDQYAIATLKGGVIIIDKTGKFLFQIDKRSGLLSNDVKYIYLDREGGMWLALQTGIARVEYGSPLSFFNPQTGFIGSTGSILRHQGVLYVGGSQGVRYLAPQFMKPNFGESASIAKSHFVPVSGIDASCWALFSFRQSLLAATDDGIFQIHGNQASVISDPAAQQYGALTFAPSIYHNNRVFVGLKNGVAVLEWRQGQWVNQGRILHIGRNVYNIIERNESELWLETRTDIAFRVTFSESGFRNPRIASYDSSAGLPPGQEIYLVQNDSGLFAHTHNEMFRFDAERNRFVPDTIQGLPFQKGVIYYSFLINGRRGNAWMALDGRHMQVAILDQAGTFQWQREPFVKTPHGLIWALFRDTDGTIWFGGDDLLFRFGGGKQNVPRTDFPALIRRIATINGDSTIFGGEPIAVDRNVPVLNYRDNALRFECAAPSYNTPSANQFQYLLEGFDTGWSKWGLESKKDYTNLPEGDYVFRVRARNVYGQQGVEATFNFTILPPWYRTGWAYGLSVLLILAILYGIRRYELSRIRLKDQLTMKRFETEKLKELNQMKSRFIANISHEFRTPLTLILGQLDGLEKEIEEPEHTKKLDVAIRHARRLQELINQLLDVAKLEAGKMPINVQKANIVPFLKNLFASFESLAAQKQLGVRFYAVQSRIDVYFEPEKLRKIFVNLIANAIKFTPEGGEVSVQVDIATNTSRAGWVEIRVRDTGPGIPEDQLPYIFNRFYQVENSNTRNYEGTGIGLALAKELVELHSGEIRVTSKVGVGTVFTVRLPLGHNHFSTEEVIWHAESELVDSVSTMEQETTPDGRIILIVEDNPDMRQYIRENLQETYTIAEATDGEQGVEMAQHLIPDLIISDVMMPNIDGYELVRQIRAHKLTSHIPVIMLTAKATEEDRLEGLESGVDAYLTKPFNIRELQIRVHKLIEMRQKLLAQRQQPLNITASDIAVTPVDEQFLQRLQKIVEENMEDEHFQVGRLCREIGISERQLYRKLQGLLGCTPAAYIRQLRLERARQLLEKGAGTVSEITFMVGYSNTSAFARAFRDAFGEAPSRFLKKHSSNS